MSTDSVRQWLNGEIVRSERVKKYYGVAALIGALFFLYICMGYGAARQQHRLGQVQKEMLDAKYRYMTICATWNGETRPSQIETKLQTMGSRVEQSTLPPTKLK